MGLIILIFIIHQLLPSLLFATASPRSPITFDDSVKYCYYLQDSRRHLYIETSSQTQSVSVNSTHQIFFKTCGTFESSEECPDKTVACIKYTDLNQINLLGLKLSLDEDSDVLLTADSSKTCPTYSIAIRLRANKEKASFIYYDDKTCTYTVEAKYSKILKKPNFNVNINGRYFDLTALDITYTVQTEARNFSVKLYGTNPVCGEGINACETTSDPYMPISLTSSLETEFIGKDNQVVVLGKTFKGPNNKTDKRFEVLLKCNWDYSDVKSEDLKYEHKKPEGKRFTFELYSLYGCVKKFVPCLVYDQNLVYNLTGLYSEHAESWTAKDPSVNSTFFLKLCNPVMSSQKFGCKNKYADICQIVNDKEMNIGSTLSHLELAENSNVVRATIDNGEKCTTKNKTFQHKTIIDFSCAFKNSGPIFTYTDNCTTHFSWETEHACPYYNVSTCNSNSDQPQIHRCGLTVDGQNFEFNSPKTIADNGEHLAFQFSLCGEVIDKDAPCMRGMPVIMKNLSEPNIRHRILSLGKLSKTSIKNNTLLFEYNTGHYCEHGDYKSEIHVECSDTEHEPIIVGHDKKCHYVFLWRSIQGCPLPKSAKEFTSKNTCSFTLNGNSVDLSGIRPFKIDSEDKTLHIDLCGKTVIKCTEEEKGCNDRILYNNRTLNLSSNSATLMLTTADLCATPRDLIQVVITFVCRENKQGHVQSQEKKDCRLMIIYAAAFACLFQTPLNPTTKKYSELQHISNKKPQEPTPLQVIKTCSIFSKFSDYELNIRNVSITFLKHEECPSSIELNKTSRFVRLFYPTTDVCLSVPSTNISYQVYLMCHEEVGVIPENKECLVNVGYNKMEYCNFFEPIHEANVGLIVGWSMGCLLIIAALAGGIIVWKRKVCSLHKNRDELISIYERDCQL